MSTYIVAYISGKLELMKQKLKEAFYKCLCTRINKKEYSGKITITALILLKNILKQTILFQNLILLQFLYLLVEQWKIGD